MACALNSTNHWGPSTLLSRGKVLIEQVEQTKLGFVLRQIFSKSDQTTLFYSACRVYLQVLEASVAWESVWVLG
jgi:hypothetical protein